MNPYLPYEETIPDGEPRLFNGRIYIYGSHDKLGGNEFCVGDYVTYSCDMHDLTIWRYEGVIYRKDQDPLNGAKYDGVIPECPMPLRNMFAPDVVQGKDGRYYLYYAISGAKGCSVAVSDKPEGPYEFLSYVAYPDGTFTNIGMMFDPAVIVEDHIYLYYGFAPKDRFPMIANENLPGGMVIELADDMHTILSEPKCVANGYDTCQGTCFEAHPYYEAPSIRHYGKYYYLVYSSLQGHELAYSMSTSPTGPFEYKGILVSNCDLGYKGNTSPTNYYGNNHGGLLEVDGQYYIFYHRQTHGTEFSRQGCIEKMKMNEDGTFNQVEVTSQGVSEVLGKGAYPAYYYCHLTQKDISRVFHVANGVPVPKDWPLCNDDGVIENMNEGTIAGFKYFDLSHITSIQIVIKGKGEVGVYEDLACSHLLAKVAIDDPIWSLKSSSISSRSNKSALYFRVESGHIEFKKFYLYE